MNFLYGFSLLTILADEIIKEGELKGIEKEKNRSSYKNENNGLDFNIISNYTGLTVEEIEKL